MRGKAKGAGVGSAMDASRRQGGSVGSAARAMGAGIGGMMGARPSKPMSQARRAGPPSSNPDPAARRRKSSSGTSKAGAVAGAGLRGRRR